MLRDVGTYMVVVRGKTSLGSKLMACVILSLIFDLLCIEFSMYDSDYHNSLFLLNGDLGIFSLFHETFLEL